MRRRRSLTEEESRLWAAVSGTAEPLSGKRLHEKAARGAVEERSASQVAGRADRQSVHHEMVPPAPVPAPAPALSGYDAWGLGKADGDEGRAGRPVPQRSAMEPYRPPVSTPSPAPLFHPIEKPVRRKLGKGRVAIEDRIDLHDRTQVVAHYVLLGFLRNAQRSGLRHVLVITGRGASFGSRGVIRRALPHWFETPEFRGLVAGFEPAERAHGGEGAFYVRVRRR